MIATCNFQWDSQDMSFNIPTEAHGKQPCDYPGKETSRKGRSPKVRACQACRNIKEANVAQIKKVNGGHDHQCGPKGKKRMTSSRPTGLQSKSLPQTPAAPKMRAMS